MSYTDKLEAEVLAKCEDIPFENSLFQDENFIVNTSYTDARAVRNIGLRLSTKIQALRELEYGLAKTQIDIEELEEKKHEAKDVFELKRTELEMARKAQGQDYTKKLLKDALYECEYLRALLAKLPKFTRAEFEAQEAQYFRISLSRQAIGLPESAKSLEAMGEPLQMPQGVRFEPMERITDRLGVSLSEIGTVEQLMLESGL